MRFALEEVMDNLLEARQLQLFVELAERGNMHRTAKALNLTPSALSHSLKRLESELGCTLFDRRGRGLHLSAHGKLFLAEAKDLLERIGSARQRFNAQRDWRRGRLRIGSTSAGCNYILPSVLREYRDSFPEITIRIVEASKDDLVEAVKASELDFAICGNEHDYRGLHSISLARENYVFVVNPMHPWAKRGKVSRQEIATQRFIVPENHTESFQIIDHYFRSDRIGITPFIEVRSEDLIKKLVALDMGVCVLPSWLATKEIREKRLAAFPLGRRSLTRRWEILHTRSHEPNFAETLFIGLAQMVSNHLMNV